jgi:hypothetical protein
MLYLLCILIRPSWRVHEVGRFIADAADGTDDKAAVHRSRRKGTCPASRSERF